jgi:Glycosyl transferase family 90
MTDLQVPADSGRMDEATVKSHYRKLAKAYLATFTQGIYRHMFFDVLRRRTYALTPPGANKGVQSMMFQVIDQKVYMMDPYEVPKNSKPFYRTRINEIIWLLSKLATAGRIKNTEFMVSIHDCVQTVNKPHTYRGATYQESIPSFTIVSCNFSDNIPFPMWEGDATRGGGFSGWDARMQDYGTASQQPWADKEERAVFRGGNRPSMYFRNKSDSDQHCDRVGRTRLAYLAAEHAGDLDVSVGGSCGGVHRYLQRLDETAQQKFKYVVYAEGNCFWADRLNKQVFGPSLLIKQDTPCGQFWEPLLKPMVHYVQTDFFFDNLIDQVKWARQNDDKVQEIVRNANNFANNFLTLAGISSYVEVLLAEYTALLVEPDVKLEAGAVEVTNKRV